MGYSGAGGKLIHKKTRSKKSRDTVPLKSPFTSLTVKLYVFTRYKYNTKLTGLQIVFCDPGHRQVRLGFWLTPV